MTIRSGWRALGLFWAAIAVGAAALGIALQVLGPPPAVPRSAPAPVAQPPAVRNPASQTPSGAIAAPDHALLEPDPAKPDWLLPRIAPDGRTPRAVYAARFPADSKGPRVGVILAGVGLDHEASEAAPRDLPAAITFAVSPYAQDLPPVLNAARAAGHEYLLSIPMEPAGRPLRDAGPQALLTNATRDQNAQDLDWALSRFAGYVGATSALGQLRGARFTADDQAMAPVLATLAQRGLLYVDGQLGTGPLPQVWGRHIDLVVDDPEDAKNVDAQLAELVRIARERGSALGLACAVRPVTVARIAAWAHGLAAQGLVLAPASALVLPPAKQP